MGISIDSLEWKDLLKCISLFTSNVQENQKVTFDCLDIEIDDKRKEFFQNYLKAIQRAIHNIHPEMKNLYLNKDSLWPWKQYKYDRNDIMNRSWLSSNSDNWELQKVTSWNFSSSKMSFEELKKIIEGQKDTKWYDSQDRSERTNSDMNIFHKMLEEDVYLFYMKLKEDKWKQLMKENYDLTKVIFKNKYQQ